MKIPSILILLTLVSFTLTFKLKTPPPTFTYDEKKYPGKVIKIQCVTNQPLKLVFPCNKSTERCKLSSSDKFKADKPISGANIYEIVITDIKSPAVAKFTKEANGSVVKELDLTFECKT